MHTPTRYPLQWPAGWKRTDSFSRTEAKFSRFDKRLSIWDGVQRVIAELERHGVGDNDIVISTNVETRLDGMPRSDRAAPQDVGVAVYWQRGGTRSGNPMRCMAVDRYNKVADNLAAAAATLEAMRAIERHGGAAILDRAFTGFTALPAPIMAGMKRAWQDVLELGGIPAPNADDVQRAYRRLAALHHPDRNGDPAKMAELNAAREDALRDLGVVRGRA